MKLSNVEISFDTDSSIGKIIVDGVDISNTTKKVEVVFDAEDRIPIVKLELYSDVTIEGRAYMDSVWVK